MEFDLKKSLDPKNRDPSKGPFPLAETSAHKYGTKLSAYHPATEMALAHNTMIRSLNAIYLQCTSVTKHEDIKDFLVYCQCWFELVYHHHTYEEDYFFPQVERDLNRPGIMAENVEQHKAFHDHLDAWGKKCYEMKPEDYDGYACRAAIEDFAPSLMVHLHDEIVSLEELARGLNESELKIYQDLWTKFNDKYLSETEKSRIFPLALGAWDCTYENSMHRFPDGPFFVPYVVNWVFSWKHLGSWKFSPSDMYSRPRKLTFLEPIE